MHDPIVCIIDDDEAIRESLRLLLFAEDLQSIVFESADVYLPPLSKVLSTSLPSPFRKGNCSAK